MAKKAKKSEDMAQPVSPSSDESWKAESDARTIIDAAEIMADPERLARAKKIVGKRKKAFRCVDDLIAYRNGDHSDESED